MPPNRNGPCPCGSGRKYKRCCWAKDRASAALRLVPEEEASPGPKDPVDTPPPDAAWEVDLVPLPVTLGDDAGARPAAVLVVGGGLVLDADIVSRPAAEPAAVADLLAEAIRTTAQRVGAPPARVLVRHATVAAALRDATLPGAPDVAAAPLRELDLAAADLVASLSGVPSDQLLRASRPETWKGWGLGGAVVADLFRAAAAFHRAKPWRLLDNADGLRFTSRSGSNWTVCVMGAGGEQFGVAMYEDPRDFRRLIEARDPGQAFRSMRGAVLSLTFDRRQDLPPRMRKEILAAGWEVAAPDACPVLLTVNTPGGGVTAAQGADVIAVLRAVPRFVEHFAAELRSRSGRQLRWSDPDTGAEVTLPRSDARADLPPRLEALTFALPQGPGAAPEAALEEHDPETLLRRSQPLLDAFEAELERSGLSARTAQRHAANAGLLLGYLADYESIPLHAMTEYDFRAFLHDWLLRKVSASAGELRGVPVSLKRFFAFVAEREKVFFPWAAGLLADRATYEARLENAPGGFFWDPGVPEWKAEVTLELSERELLPDGRMADGGAWGATMGAVEFGLHRELLRRWLMWRDEVIATGVVEPVDVRKELLQRQRSWETRPHRGCGGATPVKAVQRERAKAGMG